MEVGRELEGDNSESRTIDLSTLKSNLDILEMHRECAWSGRLSPTKVERDEGGRRLKQKEQAAPFKAIRKQKRTPRTPPGLSRRLVRYTATPRSATLAATCYGAPRRCHSLGRILLIT